MSAPSGKRRKLNETSALLKPFRSPLRKPPAVKAGHEAGGKALNNPPKTQHSTGASKEPSQAEIESPKVPSPRRAFAPATVVNPTLSKDLSTLQRQYTALLNQLTSFRTELDKINQALQIEASPRDRKLEKLTKQWRMASQQAAEEVYADVRDRVNGMGGIRVWREREEQRAQKAWGWDDEREEQRGDEESEYQEPEETEDDARKEDLAQVQNEDDEAFSIETMLRSLNVELEVIGYNREQQKWVE